MVRARRELERRSLFAFALALGLAGGALRAHAQVRVIHGTVLDTRDQPVAFVNIGIPNGLSVITDDSGRFRLRVPHTNRVTFDVKRIGYMPTRVALAAGGDTSVSVLLLPSVRELPAVDVTNTVIAPVGLAGFELRMLERKRGAGTGWFYTAKDIEAMVPTRVTQIVENTPSMVVRRTGGEHFAIYGKLVSGGECLATVYLDGIRVGGSGDVLSSRDRRGRVTVIRSGSDGAASVDDYVTTTDLAGAEVYARGIFAPVQFQPTDPEARKCAVVVFWTKHAK